MTNPQLTSLDALLQELYSIVMASSNSSSLAQAMAQWKDAIAVAGSSIDAAEILTRLESVEKRLTDKRKLDRPQDHAEVVAFFAGQGLPSSDALWFLDKMEAQGWRNNGKPVASWKATVRVWKGISVFPSQKVVNNGPANQSIRFNELKGVEERMRKIRAGYEAHQSWTVNDITEFRVLKTRRDDLKKQLGYQMT